MVSEDGVEILSEALFVACEELYLFEDLSK
jgi:hypothetical protein